MNVDGEEDRAGTTRGRGGQQSNARWEREQKTRDRTGESVREASMRKKTQKSCGRNVKNGGDLG